MCLLQLFIVEAVVEMIAYTLFAYWLVNGSACEVEEEEADLVCETMHDMNIVLRWLQWITAYIIFKAICGLLQF